MYKQSDKGKKRSVTNKKMLQRRRITITRGQVATSKPALWAKAENDLLDKGVELETLNWPDRSRTRFFRVGGNLDTETGKCRWTDEQLAIPIKKLQQYISAAQEGMFIPDKEKDELIEALEDPEHPR